jgi:hypothetical protein
MEAGSHQEMPVELEVGQVEISAVATKGTESKASIPPTTNLYSVRIDYSLLLLRSRSVQSQLFLGWMVSLPAT